MVKGQLGQGAGTPVTGKSLSYGHSRKPNYQVDSVKTHFLMLLGALTGILLVAITK